MTDNGNSTDSNKTLTLGSKLGLSKTGGTGGRLGVSGRGNAKLVTVEVKRKPRLSMTRDESGKLVAVKKDEPGAAEFTGGIDLSGLTEQERAARLRAVQQAGSADKEWEEKVRKERELNQAITAAAQKKSEWAEDRKDADDITEAPAPTVEAAPATSATAATAGAAGGDEETRHIRPAVKPVVAEEDEESEDSKRKRRGEEAAAVKKRAPQEERRQSGKLNIAKVLDGQDDEPRMRSQAAMRRAKEKARRAMMGNVPQEKVFREVILPEVITVQELANRMSERGTDVVRELMKMGMIVTASQSIDADTAELVATTLGHKVKRVTEGDVENILADITDAPATLQSRAPVVTIMGHVDHGKTSLLDAIRTTDVAASEAGGITQHIGAYRITLAGGQHITFVDTPGHEAFTAMRSRGAKVTDIVVLVVAADDGIMAQTVEAINHAKAAGVPIIVAINKIDKPNADPQRVKNELLTHELVAEEFGGEVIVVEVSAKERIGLDKLEEAILLQAEVLELHANPDRAARGAVVETKVDKGRGVITTVLIQHGTLKIGDIIVSGSTYGRVRALNDDRGRPIETATPSMPVEVLGLNDAPEAGDTFAVVEIERQAREIAEYRERQAKEKRSVSSVKMSLEQLFSRASHSGPKELPIIIKGDVHGSIEAIAGSLAKLRNEEISVKLLHSAVGAITESDITLAYASKALILGFNVRANAQAKDAAAREGVDIRYYSIIYDLVDDMKKVLGGMLDPTVREHYLGTVEIRDVFNLSKYGKVAGCFVTDGTIRRGARVRILRDNVVVYEGGLKALKRFKDDVKEVNSNFECGISFENFDDMKKGDQIEAFELISEQRSL